MAHDICCAFLQDVVIGKVFSGVELTRGSGPLDDKRQQEVSQQLRQDTRVPALARISGKGGWHPDAAHAAFTNVTLLDHVSSVVRGALQFAELDLARRLEPDELRRRLAVVAAAGFLHDADKMQGLARNTLGVADVAELIERFGITAFLARYGVMLSPAQMLALIEAAEVTQAGSLTFVDKQYRQAMDYVRLADRLDGAFLKARSTKPGEPVGLAALMAVLDTFNQVGPHLRALIADGGLRALELRDPHTPFLLDAFQAGLSAACRDAHGFPPLIEVHHDGRMLVVIPAKDSEAVIERALDRITMQLGHRITLDTNDRGAIVLLDARGTLDDLRDSVGRMPAREQEKVLRAGIEALRTHGRQLDEFMRPVGFLPRPPDLARYAGKLVPVWTGTAGDDHQYQDTFRAAVLVNALLSCDDAPGQTGIPSAERREAELRGLLGEMPAWLDGLPAKSRCTLLSGYAAAKARLDDTLNEALLGQDGLAAAWLEGRDGRPGLVNAIEPVGQRLRDAVRAHYRSLMAQRFIAANEAAEGRCHFTNAPVPRSQRVDGKMRLYGVNVSAFSGREGRPESFRSTESETLVSAVAEAEHRLRKVQFEADGRSADKRRAPVRVTSPTTAGLFGALPFANDRDAAEYDLHDVLRAEKAPGKLTYNSADAALRRTRIARFADLPTRLSSDAKSNEVGLLDFARMAFAVALRTGRPVHVFRGLPYARPEFVAFDCLPQPVERLLGGAGFRLEQVPRCIERLGGVAEVANASGFGQALALQLCDPDTRFGAACDVLARTDHRLARDSTFQSLPRMRTFAVNLLGDPDTMPTPSNAAIVEFGEAMALVQRGPLSSDGANVAELGFRTALDMVEDLGRMGQDADDSLVAGVAGELARVLARRPLFTRKELRGGRPLDDVVADAANVFVKAVWRGAFAGVPPSSRDRRVALAVYRFAFQRGSKRLYAKTGANASDEADGED